MTSKAGTTLNYFLFPKPYLDRILPAGERDEESDDFDDDLATELFFGFEQGATCP